MPFEDFFSNGDSNVQRRRSADEADDPTLFGFLDLLELDIAAHPERLESVPDALVARGRELVRGVEIDLDATL